MTLPLTGHAPGHLRDPFVEMVEDGHLYDPVKFDDIRRVTGLLWGCTDTVPGSVCSLLGLPVGSTYAHAARAVRRSLGESHVAR